MTAMQKITPFLWFDNQAEEAAEFYVSLFEKGKGAEYVTRYGEDGAKVSGMKEGSVMTVPFTLHGQKFTALNGGPAFKFTPAISFFVGCETEEEIDRLWSGLSRGGKTLMEFGKYPFSPKFGWLQDKYGLSWQLNLGKGRQKITPFFLFVGKQNAKANEAVGFYTSIFKNSGVSHLEKFGPGEMGGGEGTVKHAAFSLDGLEFMAMDSNLDHKFTFNEAVSFVVNCESQSEIDRFWEALSKGGDPSAQQCGWLKDRYGVSWQIVPAVLPELLKDPAASQRVMKEILQMKKLDIDRLKRAHDGK